MTDCEAGVLIGNLLLQSFITILQSLLKFRDCTNLVQDFLVLRAPDASCLPAILLTTG